MRATLDAFVVIENFWRALGIHLTAFVVADMYGNSTDKFFARCSEDEIVVFNAGDAASTPCACRKITSAELVEMGKDKDDCVICRLPFFETYDVLEGVDEEALQLFEELPFKIQAADCDNAPVQLPCGHVFGVECITEAMKLASLCPLCRKPVWMPPQDYWNVNPRKLDPIYTPDSWESLVTRISIDRSLWGEFENFTLRKLLQPCISTEDDEDLPINCSLYADAPVALHLIACRLDRPDLAADNAFFTELLNALEAIVDNAASLVPEAHPFRAAVEAAYNSLREDSCPFRHVPTGVNGSTKLVHKCKELFLNVVFNQYRGAMMATPRHWWSVRHAAVHKGFIMESWSWRETLSTKAFMYP